MPPPSLCGPFIGSKRSLVAFAWTVTNVLTFFCFFIAAIKIVQIHSHYRYLQHQAANYNNNDDYNNGGQNDNYNLRNLVQHVVAMRMIQEEGGDDNNRQSHDESHDDEKENIYELLSSTQSRSMAFVAIYTMVLAMGINMYGTTAIVGFTSLRGDYIAPCFSGGDGKQSKVRTGMFGGAIIVFANLLLLCAVIFGEVRVEDYRDKQRENNEDDDRELEPYAVERIATVLGVTAMFLSVLYMLFAILLFVCHHGASYMNTSSTSTEADDMLSSILGGAGGGGAGDDDNILGDVVNGEDHLSVVRNRSHGPNAGFITMESNSVD